MSNHGSGPGALRIHSTGRPGGATVELDGHNISRALRGITVRLGVEHMPTAVLDVVLHDLSTETEDTRIVVPDDTRELLVRLGWTPPAEEAAADAQA